MADPNHLNILSQGADAWNNWRDSDSCRPQLRGVDFRQIDIGLMDLSEADLSDAKFSGKDLTSIDLSDSDPERDLASEVRKITIPDFSDWENAGHFDSEFKKLLRDLEADDVGSSVLERITASPR